jgi:hypothetical protein
MILIKWFTAADCSLTAQKATALNLFPLPSHAQLEYSLPSGGGIPPSRAHASWCCYKFSLLLDLLDKSDLESI